LPKNFLEYALEIFQHFIVPESHYAEPVLRKHRRSMGVLRYLFRMLPSVKLYNEPRFYAHEIDDISADRLLSPKLEVAQAPSAQMCP